MPKFLADFGFAPSLQQAVETLGFNEATDIQNEVIPVILSQKEDVVALAKTGSGKTLSFGLPLLALTKTDEENIQSLILAPTRELAQQIYAQLSDLAETSSTASIVLATGGNTLKSQKEALKSSPQLVVGTPGRILDLVEQQALDLSQVKHLVLDEADEMFQALREELILILNQLPKKRRTFLFSATMPGKLKDIVHNYLSKNAVKIGEAEEVKAHEAIEHQYTVVAPIEKLEVLLHFLNTQKGGRGIIFCKTKAAVNKLAKNLAIRKISSAGLHGSLTQGIRDRVMGQFREGYIDILIATDLVARGIDIEALNFVVHYHLPDTYETYVHRSGRTGRAGKTGLAMTILQQDEVESIKDFEDALGIKFKQAPKASVAEIEKNNALVWAKKLFKTKPNREIPSDVHAEVKNIFHHLTKDELMDKVLTIYWNQNKKESEDEVASKKAKTKKVKSKNSTVKKEISKKDVPKKSLNKSATPKKTTPKTASKKVANKTKRRPNGQFRKNTK